MRPAPPYYIHIIFLAAMNIKYVFMATHTLIYTSAMLSEGNRDMFSACSDAQSLHIKNSCVLNSS